MIVLAFFYLMPDLLLCFLGPFPQREEEPEIRGNKAGYTVELSRAVGQGAVMQINSFFSRRDFRPTDGQTDRHTYRPTDQLTDIVSYRVACMRLKRKKNDDFAMKTSFISLVKNKSDKAEAPFHLPLSNANYVIVILFTYFG